jgi:CelD/BcsL family acetyltransferase involved in cellulose biosynthesis
MARSVADSRALLLDQMHDPAAHGGRARAITVAVAHRLDEVEAVWRGLTASGIDSPGQNFDFVRLWVEALRIAEADQFYLVATLDGAPLALVPLQRRWDKGVRVLSWFPGPHVGCNAPIVDAARLRVLSTEDRRRLWTTLLRSVEGADVVYLKAVPERIVDGVDLFGELGQRLAADTLYRAGFASFEDADRTQRNKSRRKHDRQQGERLAALGEVRFETIGNSAAAVAVLETMFRQRAARFRQMGVFDPFALPMIRRFYDSTAAAGSRLPVMLHVLRLDAAIVAVRYSIVHGDRLFCLISSMSDEAAIQSGSPGKQCLLRVMQSVFAAGYRVFDMGAGLTDEKRHWCNQQIPLRHHYMPITRRGALAASAHRGWHMLRRRIKHDERLLGLAKGLRGGLLRLKGQGKAAREAEE